MKTYAIPINWEVTGRVYVQANSLREAVEQADKMPLPHDHDHIWHTAKVDVYEIETHNNLDVIDREELEDLETRFG